MAAMAVATLALTGLTATSAHAQETELIDNGTFDAGTSPWWVTDNATLEAVDGQLCVDVPGGNTNPWDVSIGYDLPLEEGALYNLSFSASASPAASVTANVQLNVDPYTTALSRTVALDSDLQEFSYEFTGNVDTDTGAFTLQLGGEDAYTFCLDDVSLTTGELAPPPADAPVQVTNGDFATGTEGWFSYETSTPAVVDGQLCVDAPDTFENIWEAGVGQNGLSLVAGEVYALEFDASADPGATVRAALQLGEDPYTGYYSRDIELTDDLESFEFVFVAPESTDIAQLAFQVGGASEAYTLCLDNVELRGGPA
jgi:endoglucanase